jgi:plastocyanin domain-containing protein
MGHNIRKTEVYVIGEKMKNINKALLMKLAIAGACTGAYAVLVYWFFVR